MATGPTDWEKQNKGKAASAFDRAQSGRQAQTPERVDSKQIGKSAPGMNGPNPPANAKNAMASKAHNKDMAKDNDAVEKSRAEQLKDGARKHREQNQKDHGKDGKEK